MQLPDPDLSGQCQGDAYLRCRARDGLLGQGREVPEVPSRRVGMVGKAKCPAASPCTASGYGYVLKSRCIGTDDPRRHPPLPRETKKWARLYRSRWIGTSSGSIVDLRSPDASGDRITLRGQAKVTLRVALSLVVMLVVAVAMAERHRVKELRMLAA